MVSSQRSQLSEGSRSLEIVLQNFSQARPDQTFAFGATPFLVGGNRKWGANVYPFGLKPASPGYGQRVEVYVHVWAKDSRETERQFCDWIAENKVRFIVTVTEPAPVSLCTTATSESSWSDMEDAAGWWRLSFKASSKLLSLTDDTLIVRIQWSHGSYDPAIASSPPSMSLVRGDTLPLPAFTGMSLPEGMLDNPNISDFTFWVRGTAIYAQKCFLDSRLPNWKDLVGENESSIKFDVVSAATVRLLLLLVYTGSLRHLPQTTVGYAELHLIAEGFGLADLARACRRMVYATLGPTDALPLLMRFGRRSVRMRDVLAVHIVQNWAIVSASDAFRRLIDRPTRAGADALLAILQRMDTVPVDDDTAAPRRSRQPTPILDQRRFSAFRSLLDNPSVSDVHFIVEGRVITAQKSVLSEMSDYFAAMFGSGFSEGSTAGVTEIAIPDFSYGTVYSMLLYIYTCTLDAAPQTIEDIAHLYVIADKYDLPTLAEAAHQQLAGALEADAVAKFLFTFAARYPALRTLVLSVLMRDFERVKRSQGFEDALLGVEDSVEWSSLVSDILDCVSVRGFNTRADDDPSYKRGFDWDHDPESDEDYDDGDKHDNEEEEEEDEEVYALAQSHPTPASLEGSFCSTTAGTGALAAPSSPPPPLRLTPPMSPQGKRHAADDESVRRPEIDLVPQSPRRAEADENEEHSIDVADPVP